MTAKQMRIALALHNGFGFDSVKFVASTIKQAISAKHETHALAGTNDAADDRRPDEIARELVMTCDVIVGFPVMLMPVLQARAQANREVPVVVFALGAFPAGAVVIARVLPYLKTTDILVVNSTADMMLARKFVKNVRVELLPLAYDETVFQLSVAEERQLRRRALGCDERSSILLCAGRATIEKNVHTTLRIFGGVLQAVPDAHLAVAGPIENTPFSEFGVYPLNYQRTLERMCEVYELPKDRVHFTGPLDRASLASLYSVADVHVNMTLHHDENFGLAQVEANACGTRVLGTAWGGLRDTIRPGVNGLKIETRVTQLGVKVNWWEAVNKTIALLRDSATYGDEGRQRVHAESAPYRLAGFGEGLEKLLQSAFLHRGLPSSPLESTSFANRYWAACTSNEHPHARYSPDTISFDLYRELIAEYTEATSEMVHPGEPAEPSQVVALLAPLTAESGFCFAVGDPLYPFRVTIPPGLRRPARALLAALAHEPAMTLAQLTRASKTLRANLGETLNWMEQQGVIARTRHNTTWVAPQMVNRTMRVVPFQHQSVDLGGCDALMTAPGATLPRFTT